MTDADAIDLAMAVICDEFDITDRHSSLYRRLRDHLETIAAVAADNEFDRFVNAIEAEIDRYCTAADGYDRLAAEDALRNFLNRRQQER